MHHFVTEICTCVHISATKWCIVGYWTGALWDLCDKSIASEVTMKAMCKICGCGRHYSDVIWAYWRFKSLATLLFVQQLTQADRKENIKALHYWSFVGRIYRWQVDSPHKWASNTETYSMSWRHLEQIQQSSKSVHIYLDVWYIVCRCTSGRTNYTPYKLTWKQNGEHFEEV